MTHAGAIPVAVPLLFTALLGGGCAPDRPGASGPPAEEAPPPVLRLPDHRGGPSPGPGAPLVQAPISGGTLLIASDGRTAVAADPERDRVFLADLADRRLAAEVQLQPGDEPGRLAEDATGRFHVALRRGGAIASFDGSGRIVERRAVCPAPRGIGYDRARDQLHVACAGGELVSLPAAGDGFARTLRFGEDLRDVIVNGDRVYVTRFKSPELMQVDLTRGSIVARATPKARTFTQFDEKDRTQKQVPHEPAVAWRTIPLPEGRLAMIHQRASTHTVPTRPGGYGSGPCGSGIVSAAITVFSEDLGTVTTAPVLPGALPVDIALHRDGSLAVVEAALGPRPGVSRYTLAQFEQDTACISGGLPGQVPASAQVVAVAFAGDGTLVAQSRQPAALYVGGAPITLSDTARSDRGHTLFHSVTRTQIACASCHVEGGEDGRVWTFDVIGPRRTQSLRGGILGTEPFHWDGDMRDLDHLTATVFTGRMGGPMSGGLQSGDPALIGRWLDGLAAHPARRGDTVAAARGKALFESASTGCAVCHAGPRLTSSATVDVGTGRAFQVPMLVGLGHRAPYMHDGCAKTLHDRFGACGGDRHGRTAQLAPAEVDDLVAYLESL